MQLLLGLIRGILSLVLLYGEMSELVEGARLEIV